MELDHIFIFTDQHEALANALKAFGLTEGSPNVHQGQGTACRRFFFANAYLEIVWLVDEHESQLPAIEKAKFFERANYQITRRSPFGICFRKGNHESINVDELIFQDSWRYFSQYLPDGQFANIASNYDFKSEPLLFEMPWFGLAPEDYPVSKQQPLDHPKKLRRITGITLTLPPGTEGLSQSMTQVVSDSVVSIVQGPEYLLTVQFDDGINNTLADFSMYAPLILVC